MWQKIYWRGEAGMKELGNNLAQLIFIIMVIVTLAVSTAAFSQWTASDPSADASSIQQSEIAAPALSASVTP
jgi:flagellar basal body-associated protein FliL